MFKTAQFLLVVGMAAALVVASGGCRRKPGATPGGVQPAATTAPAEAARENWLGFRGPNGDGSASPEADPPVTIDLARDLLFKVKVPASGNSSPIVSGDKVFLTGETDRVIAFDRATGRLLWDTQLSAPPVTTMPGDEDVKEASEDTGLAAPTPCTDGRRVYAFFGTSVLGCVDADGRQIWADRLVVGKVRNSYGLAASPVLAGELLIQVLDLGNDPEDNLSFIVAVRAADGVEVWRQDRPVQSSWSTPLLLRSAGGDQLVTTALPMAISYDPASGRELWRAEELSGDVAACPVACDGRVYAPSGEGGELLAIRPDGRGDVTKTHVLWKKRLPLPDVASPVCLGKRYFHVSAGGDLFCLDGATGNELWTKELRGTFWSSAILVKDRIYLVNTDGRLYVVAAEDGRILAEANLGEKTATTPAIVGGRIYIRTEKHLLCIGRGGPRP